MAADRKKGRNEAKCKKYKQEMRREISHLRSLVKHMVDRGYATFNTAGANMGNLSFNDMPKDVKAAYDKWDRILPVTHQKALYRRMFGFAG